MKKKHYLLFTLMYSLVNDTQTHVHTNTRIRDEWRVNARVRHTQSVVHELDREQRCVVDFANKFSK